MQHAQRALVRSPNAEFRLARAVEWLAQRGRAEEVLIVGQTFEAATELTRSVALRVGASFGWHRATLGRVAAELAAPGMMARDLSPAGALPLEALCARVVDELRRTPSALGRFADVAHFPGFPRALARTLGELRLAGYLGGPDSDDRERLVAVSGAELARIHDAYEFELAQAKLADRALVFRIAIDVARGGQPTPRWCSRSALLGRPILLFDVAVAGAIEVRLLGALTARSPSVLALVPDGDEPSLRHLRTALGLAPEHDAQSPAVPEGASSLRRLQAHLFDETASHRGTLGDDVTLISAPGESRECVEIARLVQREAARGVRFDRMAILLRAPAQYRAHLEEALRRASIPAYFAKGTVQPDPAGRAFVALLACAAEKLSARRFAEYLSLGQVPNASRDGQPPPSIAAVDRWVRPDEEFIRVSLGRAAPVDRIEDETALIGPKGWEGERGNASSTVKGTLRAPRRWERLLVESAVIGGLDRWKTRLGGLRSKLVLDLQALDVGDEAAAERVRRSLDDLDGLGRFALPLLHLLSELPDAATWGVWIDKLSALATRALRRPERVLAVLAELLPMADIGPVSLAEVRLVLGKRLTDLVVAPQERAAGRVFVAPIDGVRGLTFDVVFVPGLAEKIFPQKVVEDPVLLDRARVELGLDTNRERVAQERLALRLAVGSATKRLVLSYPRVDMDQSRPRVPSFYGLEVIRAAEGILPGFDELMRRAEQGGASRIGWPAPASPALAIDHAEYDLALLDDLFQRSDRDSAGTAHYLLGENEHLARALRHRARRWTLRKWVSADGLVDPQSSARAALDRHVLGARSFSPTALQHFASCPYRFFLSAVHKLAAREAPVAIEEMDPIQRGALVHEVLYALLDELRTEGALPVTPDGLDAARAHLDRVLDRTAARYKDELAPAIERVWDDGITQVRADLREWLRRAAGETTWVPWRFELSFGLNERRERDPGSDDEPVVLDCGLRLRGSIDLVERRHSGALRATDYKTGAAEASAGASVVFGGRRLQPVLYALALEKMFPNAPVDAGRLYHCTSAGGFEEVPIPLDEEARRAAGVVAEVIGKALAEGFFPAAPDKGACERCEYRVVCGPYEEIRAARKSPERLGELRRVRGLP